MSGRLDRYGLAILLAQEILQGNPDRDEFRIEQAAQDIRDEVAAGRRNQAEMPQALERARELLGRAGYDDGGEFSPAVPVLKLVNGGGQ